MAEDAVERVALKPCPFCGAQLSLYESYRGGAYYKHPAVWVEGGRTGPYTERPICVLADFRLAANADTDETGAWNTRAAIDALSGEASDGSVTLDNASVQRLLDYGVLHYENGKWTVAGGTALSGEVTEAMIEAGRKVVLQHYGFAPVLNDAYRQIYKAMRDAALLDTSKPVGGMKKER